MIRLYIYIYSYILCTYNIFYVNNLGVHRSSLSEPMTATGSRELPQNCIHCFLSWGDQAGASSTEESYVTLICIYIYIFDILEICSVLSNNI